MRSISPFYRMIRPCVSQGNNVRSVAEALDELERFSGTQFDPVVVKALVKLIRAETGAIEGVPAV